MFSAMFGNFPAMCALPNRPIFSVYRRVSPYVVPRHCVLGWRDMAREFSAGGLVVRKMRGVWSLAVIHPRRDETPAKPVLALPKGNIDAGEKPEQAALREVREEAGLEAEVMAKLGDTKYVYVRTWGDRQRVFKIVSFYLLRYKSGKLGEIAENMRHEVAGAEWIALDAAPRLLSYKGEKEIARKAVEYLAAHPELQL
jgi:8-oxo-dGTP pyrophosphatase MutT (NUDIX family)